MIESIQRKRRTVCFVVSFITGGHYTVLHELDTSHRQIEGDGEERSREREGVSPRSRGEFPTRRGRGSRSRARPPTTRASDVTEDEEKGSTIGRCFDHLNRARSGAGMDRTGVTVATIKTVATLRGVSTPSSISFCQTRGR